MTTARERLKALSGLSGAHPARAHLLAITQGSGSGQTLFASRFSVQIETPQLFAVERHERAPLAVTKRASASLSEVGKDLCVATRNESLAVRTGQEELFVTAAKLGSTFVHDLGNETFIVRKRDVLEFS